MARGNRGTPTREKSWLLLPGLQVAGQADGQFFGSGFLSFGEAATILRCRGEIVLSWVAAAAGELATVSLGLMVSRFNTSTVAIGDLPDASDGDGDFLWWKQVPVIGVAAGRSTEGPQVCRVELDTKAMRRVKPNDVLTIVARSTGSSTGTLDYLCSQVRVLIAE